MEERLTASPAWELLHGADRLLTEVIAGRDLLRHGLLASGARGGLIVWLLLFCVVSLQAATFLRPVMLRKPGVPIFVSGKKSFLEQIGDVFDEPAMPAAKPAKAAPVKTP